MEGGVGSGLASCVSVLGNVLLGYIFSSSLSFTQSWMLFTFPNSSRLL